jgi:uncharacterized protein with HEPN domain
MNPESRERVRHALDACDAIAAFISGRTRDDYLAQAMLRSAVERQFEIIGESLSRATQLDPSVEISIPELRRIVGMRNRIIHGYDSVDDELLWSVATTNVPELAETLRVTLKE